MHGSYAGKIEEAERVQKASLIPNPRGGEYIGENVEATTCTKS